MHIVVSGVVQGVCYRQSTETKAVSLGLTGWVQNIPTGQVEIMVTGNSKDLATFEAWLWQGPKLARVDEVVVNEVMTKKIAQFNIKRVGI